MPSRPFASFVVLVTLVGVIFAWLGGCRVRRVVELDADGVRLEHVR